MINQIIFENKYDIDLFISISKTRKTNITITTFFARIACPTDMDSCKLDPQGYKEFVLSLMYLDDDNSGCLDHGEYVTYAKRNAGTWFISEQVVESAGKPIFSNATYDRLWTRWVNGRRW